MSRIAVIGLGYVGLTTAACFADLGNEVCGVDVDETRVRNLELGELPLFEPGLQELLLRNVAAGRLTFTASYAEAVPEAEFVFLAVGTPMGDDGEADLTYVREAAAMIAEHFVGPTIVVSKSTVPVGTGDVISDIIRSHVAPDSEVQVVSNPEFLREGSAIHDFMAPDRVVLGGRDRKAVELVAELYKPLNAPVLVTTPYTAEMIKYASNAFLATKVSFINEVARVCEALGADVQVVAEGMGMDHRVGPAFLEAGVGYGGSCFPKDVTALAHMFNSTGAHPQLLHAVMEINHAQPALLATKVREAVGPLDGRTIGILGLSFKPNTDDMREAPSLSLIPIFQRAGATVRAFDPAAMPTAIPLLPGLVMVDDAYAAAADADALVIVTEWNEFRQLDLERIKALMRSPVIIDGRNIYDPKELTGMGFLYKGVGR